MRRNIQTKTSEYYSHSIRKAKKFVSWLNVQDLVLNNTNTFLFDIRHEKTIMKGLIKNGKGLQQYNINGGIDWELPNWTCFCCYVTKKRSIWPTFPSKKARHACRLHAFPCNLLRKVVLFWTCNMPFDYVFSDCVQCCKLKKALKMLKNFFHALRHVK